MEVFCTREFSTYLDKCLRAQLLDPIVRLCLAL